MNDELLMGECRLCRKSFPRKEMTEHLESCGRSRPSAGSKRKKAPGKTRAFHLEVEGTYLRVYWMHIEASAEIHLGYLDNFLRAVWLECCGHQSAFTIDGTRYSTFPMKEFRDEGMNTPMVKHLSVGKVFSHEYDFGTTTKLTLRVISEREVEMGEEVIRLLARNEPPRIACQSCGNPATQVCSVCIYDDEGWLCDACMSEHPCGEDMFLPVVNSPRVGECGYMGSRYEV